MGMDKFSEELRLGVEEIREVSMQLAQIIGQVQHPRGAGPAHGRRQALQVADVAGVLFEAGAYEVSLGDTIGTCVVLCH